MKKAVTLVELAVVLIVIGLLVGITFKGFELIKTSRVTAEAGKIQKITSAIITFKAKHGRLPGDGCGETPDPTTFCTGAADGIVDGLLTSEEDEAFWQELYLDGLLALSDRKSELGENNYYILDPDGIVTDAHHGIYLTLSGISEKLVCKLDQQFGDGINTLSKTDSLIMSENGTGYTPTTDCDTITNNDVDTYFLVYKY